MNTFKTVDESQIKEIAECYGLEREGNFNYSVTFIRKVWNSFDKSFYLGNINKDNIFILSKIFEDKSGNNIFLFNADSFLGIGTEVTRLEDKTLRIYFDFIKHVPKKYVDYYPFTCLRIDGQYNKSGQLYGKMERGADWNISEPLEARLYTNEHDVIKALLSKMLDDNLERLKDMPFESSNWGRYKNILPAKSLEKIEA